MKRTKLLIIALLLSSITYAQLGIDVNKNYKILRNMQTSEIEGYAVEQQMGMDVDKDGNIIIVYTARDKNGKDLQLAIKYDATSGYEDYKWKTYEGFGLYQLINEVKALNDNWVVVSGKGFVMFLNEDLRLQYTLDAGMTETFRDADFMEIDQTPDGKIVVLYSYNLEYGKDKLGLLVVDRAADDFYYAQIGYEGNWDENKREGGVAKDFEMVALDNKYCMVGFNPNKYGENAHLNAYLVVDITKVIRSGEANIVNAVVKKGDFGSGKKFRDMAWDSETRRLYTMVIDVTQSRNIVVITQHRVSTSTTGVFLTEENVKNYKEDDFESPLGSYKAYCLSHFNKNGYKPNLIIGGRKNRIGTNSDFGHSPNLNVLGANNLRQSTLGGRTITNKIYEESKDPLYGWNTKEVIYIGKSLGGVMNGNYKDAVAVLVYKDGEELAKLILVDLTYMGL